jgi:cellulose biosynthesis protein BcsQ
VIAVGNQKGGVGKTTNTIQLAGALAERGRKSLIIDLDMTSGATKALRAPTDHCRCSECRFLKMNTLEKVRDCLLRLSPRIELPAPILERARLPIERMLEISARPT